MARRKLCAVCDCSAEDGRLNISLCTITFRHQLISLGEIARFAQHSGFDGIELWGAHARNLKAQPDKNADWLHNYGLVVPMISDYLPLEGDIGVLRERTVELCQLARRWRADKIRTFAGGKASAETSAEDRAHLVARLREVAAIVQQHGVNLLIETHPDTLADSAASTIRLLEEIDHPAVAINFDVLHVWEAGDDPVALHRDICAFVQHYHFKNITERRHLAVFKPGNVYSAAGDRTGMTPLFEGAVDYAVLIPALGDVRHADVSLEWFGDDPSRVLREDCKALRHAIGFENPDDIRGTQPIRRATP
jgi:3-dehydroshikimate dehydratase